LYEQIPQRRAGRAVIRRERRATRREQIGAGSYGAVYCSGSHLQREVAVKVILLPYASDPEFIRLMPKRSDRPPEHPYIARTIKRRELMGLPGDALMRGATCNARKVRWS
jgi:serine/threonine protein kinase